LANSYLTKIFKKAVSNTCDLIVKQNKPQDIEELSKNIKETITSSKIQLKPDVVA
jgi:hypothetical protein